MPGYLKKMLNIEIVKFDVEKEEPIRDERGFCIPCEIGEVGEAVGEIQIDAGAFDGYVDKQATQKKILRDVFKKDDQWFRSGDLLSRDRDGYFYFIDRIGDTFRWKGENVATSEVAHAFQGFKNILEVNVYGVDLPGNDGKAGMAALVSNAEINLKDLYFHLKSSLPGYAMPIILRVKKEIEITGTFKHKKIELVKEGYNPEDISDPLFFIDDQNENYIGLDYRLYERLINKEITL